MSDALVGFLIFAGIIHFFLVLIPVIGTIKSVISVQSKLAWCLFLLLLPLVGVAVFHYYFRSSIFRGKIYHISAEEERSRSGTLAPDDNDFKQK